MRILLFLDIMLFANMVAFSQPKPGDVFRDYTWLPVMVSENGKFLRVGGKLDYQINEKHFSKNFHADGYINFDQDIKLAGAVKAELLLEKVGSHDDTKGLRVQINRNKWITIPDAPGIPAPQSVYMHHYYPIVEVSLDQLHDGNSNLFKLEVDSVQRWNWPQNLIYGVTIRIYYDTAIPGISMNLVNIGSNENQIAQLSIKNNNLEISEVIFMGNYKDYNREGDGNYNQWHYHYHKGVLMHHIGSTAETPHQIKWSLSWIPNQDDFQVGAWVKDKSGLTYFIEGNTKIELKREGYEVHLYQPSNQPANWVTRSGEFSEKINVTGNIEQMIDFQLAWTSWSPCYANGVFVNDFLVFMREGPCYDYFSHELTLSNKKYLRQAENSISTGKTPLFQGQMVHGMEVQWPGIMVKVRYKKP